MKPTGFHREKEGRVRVSIITVCFNSEKTIAETIRSVLEQDYPAIEYIVIDGGSSDSTVEIIEMFADRITSFVSEPDHGIYDAMNKGLRMAAGDIVGILNSDDVYFDATVVSDMVAAFAREKSPDMIFGDIVFVRPDNLRKIVRYYNARHFQPWMLRFGWMPPHPGTFIKREAYKQAGGYKTSYQIAADYEIFVRMLLVLGQKATRANRVIVRMRTGGESTRGILASWRLNYEIVRACRENGVYTNLLMVAVKIPFKLLELWRTKIR